MKFTVWTFGERRIFTDLKRAQSYAWKARKWCNDISIVDEEDRKYGPFDSVEEVKFQYDVAREVQRAE